MKKLLAIMAGVALFAGVAQADIILIFEESMGTVTANTTFETHTTNEGWDNNGLTFSGSGGVRITTASSGYTGASGGANVFLNNEQTFIISGINTMGFTQGFNLSFGAHKNIIASDMTELGLAYSTDGDAWTGISIPAQPTGTGTSNWRLIGFEDVPLPNSSTLQLRWTNTQESGSPQFRIDDVRLEAIPEPGTIALFGLGVLGIAFVRRRADPLRLGRIKLDHEGARIMLRTCPCSTSVRKRKRRLRARWSGFVFAKPSWWSGL